VQRVSYAKTQSDYRIWLIGYASKLGDTASNQHLSLARMNSVLRFMGTVDSRALSKLDSFMARGSAGYVAGATDNSADERAVEVHIFIGTPPPDDPPPDITPTPHLLPPLPGGKRYSKWAVAAPGGGAANIAPGIVIGFNIFVFRSDETGEKKAYISPQVGFGLSYSLKGGKLLFAVQTLLTSPAYSNMDFTKFTMDYPLTWAELGDAGVTVSSAGGRDWRYWRTRRLRHHPMRRMSIAIRRLVLPSGRKCTLFPSTRLVRTISEVPALRPWPALWCSWRNRRSKKGLAIRDIEASLR
jgi:hypothetical protein